MSTTVEVIELKGAIWCPKCTTKTSYDLNGRPPGSIAIVSCTCGLTIRVRRVAMRSSLGPKELKGGR
jgi:hypothetical protein